MTLRLIVMACTNSYRLSYSHWQRQDAPTQLPSANKYEIPLMTYHLNGKTWIIPRYVEVICLAPRPSPSAVCHCGKHCYTGMRKCCPVTLEGLQGIGPLVLNKSRDRLQLQKMHIYTRYSLIMSLANFFNISQNISLSGF